jgi:hypothetical protein
MDTTTYVLLVDMPLLMLGLGLIAIVAWNRSGGIASILGKGSTSDMRLVGMATMFGLWLLLTVSSLCLAFGGGLVVFCLLLFWVGGSAAAAAAILLAAFLACIPFLWGWALLRPAARH